MDRELENGHGETWRENQRVKIRHLLRGQNESKVTIFRIRNIFDYLTELEKHLV